MKDEPANIKSLPSPKILWDAVVKVGQMNHRTGDLAEANAQRATSRREQRKWQSLNKASRAVGTAAEASLWLTKVVMTGVESRDPSSDTETRTVQACLYNATMLLDELVFEANVINSLAPQPDAKPKKKGR